MKTYPDTDFYLINYFPGSSGTFLQSLMVLIHHDSHFNSLTGTGNASNSINPRFFNEKFDPHGLDNKPIYQNVLNVIPINKTKPVFSRSHNLPDINILYNKFPKTCHIIIKLDTTGKMIACLQDFQKNFVDQYRLGIYSNSYNKWTSFSQQYFNNATHPKNVTDSQLLNYAKDIGQARAVYPYDINDNFNNTLSINLTDIYFNKDYILDMISDLIKKPVNESAINYYDTYLTNQQKILSLLGNANI